MTVYSKTALYGAYHVFISKKQYNIKKTLRLSSIHEHKSMEKSKKSFLIHLCKCLHLIKMNVPSAIYGPYGPSWPLSASAIVNKSISEMKACISRYHYHQ